jgi:hypothetical protein
MKHRVLRFLAAAGLLVVLLLVALRLPAIQRRLLLWAVGGKPSLQLRLDHLSAGMGAAEMKGVELVLQGATVRLPHLRAEYNGWKLLFGREIIVDSLVANDVEVLLSASAKSGPAAAPAGPPAAVAGFLGPLQSKTRMTIRSVELGGRLHLSPERSVVFSAQGNLVEPGARSQTNIRLSWTDHAAVSPVPALDWVGQLTTTADASGAIGEISTSGTLAMPKSKSGGPEHGLFANIVAKHLPGQTAETLEATLRLSSAKMDDPPLAIVRLTHRSPTDRIDGDWRLNLRREQLAGVVDLERLPDFSGAASGAFSLTPSTGDFSADAKAKVEVQRLGRIRSELGGVGDLVLSADLAVSRAAADVMLSRVHLSVDDSVGAVLALEALQPVGYNTENREFKYGDPTRDLARLEAARLPLVWLQPIAGDIKLSGTAGGELRLKGGGRAWSLETTQRLHVADCRCEVDGKTLLDRTSGDIELRATVDGRAWAVAPLGIDLQSVGEGARFAALALRIDASQTAEGSGQIRMPVAIESLSRRTDMAVAGGWSMKDGKPAVDMHVSGNSVWLDDLAALAGLMQSQSDQGSPKRKENGKKPQPPVTAKGPEMGDEPFWGKVSGRLDIDIKKVVTENAQLSDLNAVVAVDPRKLSLEKVAAHMPGAALDAKAAIDFDPSQKKKYSMRGQGTVPGFDIGAWLRAAAPGEVPTIDAVVNIDARLESEAAEPAGLLEAMRGECALQGGPGVLRIKDKRVEAASAVAGVLRGLLSKDKAGAALAEGSRIIDELREFRFDQLGIELQRGDDLALQLRRIDIRSADKRLTGSGTATYVAGRSITAYPLNAEMWLAGKGSFGALLDQAKLLDGSKDEAGYQRIREPFTLTGTVGQPNWKKMLLMLGGGLATGR